MAHTGGQSSKPKAVFSVDVEDWFHILDSPAVPAIEQWPMLEQRAERNVQRMLELFAASRVRATFFWLGWMAQRNRQLVRRCQQAGHEIASHGFGHVLAYKIGPDVFREDITRAKDILEDITGQRVRGFRAPGFGITPDVAWAFDVIRDVGHEYDSSVFPLARGHGGMPNASPGPHCINTSSGPLIEIPISVFNFMRHRMTLFGGGYLRIAPKWLIRWGVKRLHAAQRPLIVYIHPREIDPEQPRLPLSRVRRFKSYVNLGGTMPKLQWLCRAYDFFPMAELADQCSLSSRETVGLEPVVCVDQSMPAVPTRTISSGNISAVPGEQTRTTTPITPG